MELLTPTTGSVLAYYDHPQWGKYAAITKNHFGKGIATYIGCIPSKEIMKEVLQAAIKEAGLWQLDQEITFPLITKNGVNADGKSIRYYFNYSGDKASFQYPHQSWIFTSDEVMGNSRLSPSKVIR